MTVPSQNLFAPDLGDFSLSSETLCTLYRQRQDVLTLIKQLTHMIQAVQRHRGMSMALLAGSTLFRKDFEVLQRQIQQRLDCLEAFAARTEGLLDARDKVNLHNAWHTVRVGWQGDEVVDNFELHAYAIEQLQGMIVTLARHLEHPVSAVMAETLGLEPPTEAPGSHPKSFRQIELLDFAVRQVMPVVEQIGRIRALSTYAAARGTCDDNLGRKLRYALSCVRTANEKLRPQIERLESVLGTGTAVLTALSMMKTYELKLMFLLNTVESDVLSGGTITASSHHLFRLATEIMDVYLKAVDQSMDILGLWHQQDLEDWLCWVGSVPAD